MFQIHGCERQDLRLLQLLASNCVVTMATTSQVNASGPCALMASVNRQVEAFATDALSRCWRHLVARGLPCLSDVSAPVGTWTAMYTGLRSRPGTSPGRGRLAEVRNRPVLRVVDHALQSLDRSGKVSGTDHATSSEEVRLQHGDGLILNVEVEVVSTAVAILLQGGCHGDTYRP